MKPDFDFSRRPNIIPWPPIILGIAIVASIVFSALLPIRDYFYSILIWFSIPGMFILIGGLLLGVWALIELFWNSTNIQPHMAADRLVTSGPFSFSRNPIYLGNTAATIGIGLAFNQPWFIVMGMMHAALVQILAIEREELHLEARFGKDWVKYRNRVSRWYGAKERRV